MSSYRRYKTERERGRLYPEDTGFRRREYELKRRQETRRSVYLGHEYLGYVDLVDTDIGKMWNAHARTPSHKTVSIGTFDTADEAADAITEWFDE